MVYNTQLLVRCVQENRVEVLLFNSDPDSLRISVKKTILGMFAVGRMQNFEQFVESGDIHSRNPEALARVKKTDIRKSLTPDGAAWNIDENTIVIDV